MTPTSPTALEEAADAAFGEMDDRGLFKDVGDDLFDEIKTDVATAAITAYLVQAEKEGWVMVPNSALAWLFGEGPDADGHWFEPPEIKEGERKKPYWWRSKFSAMLAAAQNGGDLPAPPRGK